MSASAKYPHLAVDQNGVMRIEQTRYKVIHLAAEHYHHGWTAEELLRQHLDLRPAQVYSALAYFYDHHDAMVAEMKSSFTDTQARRVAPPFTKDDLSLRGRKTQES